MEDSSLKRLFLLQKREDEKHAPAFTRTWIAALSRRAPAPNARRKRRIVIATLSVGLLATVVIFSMLWTISAPVRQSENAAVAILNWQSPTDALLSYPGQDLIKTAPSLRRSVVPLRVEIQREE